MSNPTKIKKSQSSHKQKIQNESSSQSLSLKKENIYQSVKLNQKQLAKTYFDLIQKVGSKGIYQTFIFMLFSLNWFITGCLMLGTSFIFLKQDFTCGKDVNGLLVEDCGTAVCNLDQSQWSLYLAQKKVNSLTTQYGQYYCQNASILTLLKSSIYVGTFFGYIIFLFFTDNYGRRTSLLIAWGVTCFGLVMLCASFNMGMAVVGLVLAGAGSQSAIRINMAIFGQIIDYYLRQKYSVALQISYGFAGVFVGIIYYLLQDWRIITIYFVAIPAFISFILIFFLFEQTPKFILKKGIQKACKSLNRIGKMNKGRNDLITYQDLQNVMSQQVQDQRFNKIIPPWDIFRFPSLRVISICMGSIFFLTNYLYFGPIFSIQSIGFDPFISQIILSGSQLIAYPFSYLVIEKMPRKKSGIILYGISGLVSIILIFIEKPVNCQLCTQSLIQLMLNFISRLAIAFYYSILFLYITQLYPLRARGQGFGVASSIGAISSSTGSIVIINLFDDNGINHYILYTIVALLSISCLFFLQETKNKPLPNQIYEIQMQKDKFKKTVLQSKKLSQARKSSQQLKNSLLKQRQQ